MNKLSIFIGSNRINDIAEILIGTGECNESLFYVTSYCKGESAEDWIFFVIMVMMCYWDRSQVTQANKQQANWMDMLAL